VPVRVNGREQVASVVLARIDRQGAVMPGSEREIACDVVAVNYGFAANSELAAMAGVVMHHDPTRGGWLPVVDEFGRTSLTGIFAAGDGAALRGALVAEAEGELVGAAAAADPEEIARPGFRASLASAFATRERLSAFQSAMQELLRVPPKLWRLPTDGTIICRCENVTFGVVRDALAAGHLAPNTIKRVTRAGMGWCGGRICLQAVSAVAELHGASSAAMMTPRPLVRPIPLASLANQVAAGRP